MPRAIVQLAAALNVGTVAEGIETQEQAEMLQTMSCARGQGNLFGEPMPVEIILAQLGLEPETGSEPT